MLGDMQQKQKSMTENRIQQWAQLIVAIGVLCALRPFSAHGEKPAPHEPRVLSYLLDARINESSGLVASRLTPDVYWTHNDSGGGEFLFAINRKGETLARYRVKGADCYDWEDIAIGPGLGGKPALYIGDIGDNHLRRMDVRIYRLTEPAVSTTMRLQELTLKGVEEFPYAFPDGFHNSETLLVHPKTGEVVLVTKDPTGVCGVYTFPLPLKPGEKVTLKKVTTFTITDTSKLSAKLGGLLTTGGDVAPNGETCVVRTYRGAFLWKIAPGQSVAEALGGKPQPIDLPFTTQGESICYSADGKCLLITSEGAHGPLYEIPLVEPRSKGDDKELPSSETEKPLPPK